jgi:hypothetical protein
MEGPIPTPIQFVVEQLIVDPCYYDLDDDVNAEVEIPIGRTTFPSCRKTAFPHNAVTHHVVSMARDELGCNGEL